ncbi:MAG: SDR family oxidoreductase [Burkholderiaceae bacterium]
MTHPLTGKVAWVTGAGSGIGEGIALALAAQGAITVLTGRRREPLEAVADQIRAAGGIAWVRTGDLAKAATSSRIVAAIDKKFGRLDIVVNNAGMNILRRSFEEADASGFASVIDVNLTGAFYCVHAALPIMRRQRDGLFVHTASWAGRFVSRVAGPAYTAAKHGVVAMSYALNMEEFVNGIRSTAICPAEVATPIMDKRPVPVSAEERARMIQPADMGRLVAHIATTPAHVCLNEVVISPTWNRSFLGTGAPALAAKPPAKASAARRRRAAAR